MPHPRPDQSSVFIIRILLTTNAILLGITAGLIAAVLRWLDGGSIPEAIMYGCGAFVTGVFLTFGIIGFWRDSRPGERPDET